MAVISSSLINLYFARLYFEVGIDKPPSPGYRQIEKDQQNSIRMKV
jgi:hypothetical protein